MELSSIPDNAIPLAVLADLTDADGEVSVWLVSDLEGSLRRVAAALQPKDRQPSRITFRVVEQDRLGELSIDQPKKSHGDSLDSELNDNIHYVFDITTNGNAIPLARAFTECDQVAFIQSVIVAEMLHSIREGRIKMKDFGRDLCKWLVADNYLFPAPSGSEATGVSESTQT